MQSGSSVINSSLQNSVAVSFSLYCKFCYAARSVLRAGPVVHVLAVLRLDTGATHALLLAQWSMSLLCCAWTQMRLGTQLVNLLAEGCLSPLNLVALSIQGVLSLISIQIRQVSRLGRTPMCPNQSDACQIHCSAYNWSLSRWLSAHAPGWKYFLYSTLCGGNLNCLKYWKGQARDISNPLLLTQDVLEGCWTPWVAEPPRSA